MKQRPATTSLASLAAALLLLGLLATPGHGQFGKLKQKAKQAADQAVDKAATDAVTSATTSSEPAPAPAAEPAAAPAATPAASPDAAATPAAVPATVPAASKEWANYDFVPGSRIIFDTDFTEDRVGNFPQRLEFKSGQLEVVDLDGVRMLKASDHGEMLIPLPEALPDRYTIEVDFLSKNGTWNAFALSGGSEGSAEDGTRVDLGDQGVEIRNNGATVVNSWFSEAQKQALKGTLVHARFQGDGKYLKVYANERRVANIPNANVKRGNMLYLALMGSDGGDRPVYVSRIRVAETQATVYDALSSTGRWSTQGILFSTGKSDIRPESTPTLKEIAAALTGHPDLKVEIQGHTDNVGKAADNQALSEARAAAVKAALVAGFGVNAAQLTTKGYGDAKPVADNKTAEGRQNNRRVELVKQ